MVIRAYPQHFCPTFWTFCIMTWNASFMIYCCTTFWANAFSPFSKSIFNIIHNSILVLTLIFLPVLFGLKIAFFSNTTSAIWTIYYSPFSEFLLPMMFTFGTIITLSIINIIITPYYLY